ncbi:hypothetical protein [Lentilactobacillus hilgardii]|uniref:hypothetical protein n=1 Tax=Lentilactobacillus hilgardii TaxID=1588 RepID=UPI0021A5F900|nr:hypothetical protein [Lentilactobacillus hilgardii]MCT3398878.1 hypothetical protein [Lentilactobacillus hilgardii]
MKKVLISVATTMAVLLGFICFENIQEASAHVHYTTIPKSLRGTWYNWNEGKYSKTILTKHHWYYKGPHKRWSDLSGIKKAQNSNHSQLFVDYVKNGYYCLGAYGSDEWPFWKRTKTYLWTNEGKKTVKKTYTCLKEYEPLPDKYGYHDVEFWFHFKQMS